MKASRGCWKGFAVCRTCLLSNSRRSETTQSAAMAGVNQLGKRSLERLRLMLEAVLDISKNARLVRSQA
jgi:hypothetical protein